MAKNLIGINHKRFTFDVVLTNRWRLWFWWRDWMMFKMDSNKEQRLWKLQIGPIMFCYWHKR